MKIVSLTKTFSGDEFVIAAIKSLYSFVDNFVFVNSDVSWTGKTGNTVKPIIEKWKKENDKENKIINFDCNARNQQQQYDSGYNYIRENLDADWIMVFDTDEVWDFTNIERARNLLKTSNNYNAIACNMHTYIKSPFYRVTPPEYCKPTAFIRPIFHGLQGIRGNGVTPRLFVEELFFHHFTYVRSKEKDVFDKIQTSLLGDQEDVPCTRLVNIKKWKREKWDKMPKAYNFHTTKGFEKSWHRLKTIKETDLPTSVQGTDIVEQWRKK